jgi:steroid 5-alpha reductase family enzyme
MTASTIQPHTPLALSDYGLALAALVVLALEFTSDNQQYSFQTYKHAFLASEKGNSDVEPYDAEKQWPGSRLDWTPEDARRGFVTKGLWAYVRHPNFACEQLFWVCLLHRLLTTIAHRDHLSG